MALPLPYRESCDNKKPPDPDLVRVMRFPRGSRGYKEYNDMTVTIKRFATLMYHYTANKEEAKTILAFIRSSKWKAHAQVLPYVVYWDEWPNAYEAASKALRPFENPAVYDGKLTPDDYNQAWVAFHKLGRYTNWEYPGVPVTRYQTRVPNIKK